MCKQQISNPRITLSLKNFVSCSCAISVGKWILEGKDGVLCAHDEGEGHELYCPEHLSYFGVSGFLTSVTVR